MLNGETASATTPLWPGQTLAYSFFGYEEPELNNNSTIIIKQNDLALVKKPVGLPVHKTGRIFFQTLEKWAKTHLGDEWNPLHRLDVETGGVVAFAKGKDVFKTTASEAPASQWHKLYLAVVAGNWEDRGLGKRGCFTGALGERPGDIIRSRMHVHDAGKAAQTKWWCLHSETKHSLLLAAPRTGRKHQIRAHLSHAGYPIVGDKMYAQGGWAYLKRLEQELSEADLAKLGAPHHLLHALYLSIEAPGHAIQGFDLHWSPAFDAYCDRQCWGDYFQSPAFADILAEMADASPCDEG